MSSRCALSMKPSIKSLLVVLHFFRTMQLLHFFRTMRLQSLILTWPPPFTCSQNSTKAPRTSPLRFVFFIITVEYHDYCRMYDHCQVCSYHYHMMSISSFYILHHESVCIFSIIVLLFYVIIVLLAKTSLRLGAHNNHVLYVHNCFCICIVKQHASLDN